MSAKEAAWDHHLSTKRNSRQARRSSFDAGWSAGQDDAATKIADLLDKHTPLIKSFAGDRAPELIAHLVRTLAPIRGNAAHD